MEKDRIAMSQKELSRFRVITLAHDGHISVEEAARQMGLSTRQTSRLLGCYRTLGVQGLFHGNRGRTPPNHLSPELRQKVLELAEGPYTDVNDRHLQELLAEREGIQIGRETLRSLLREAGFKPKRKRRPSKHRRRRERSPAKGLMVIWDGSPHRWLGEERPPCTLMAAQDDADSEVVAAFFTPHETTEAYLRLLRAILRKRGIPVSIYQDKHSALKRNDPHWSLEEQLSGEQTPTQVGQALKELGIQPIFAHSPQAKGRIERLFGTLQDRLVAELRLAGISDIGTANRFLTTRWLKRFNRTFKRQAAENKSCYRSDEGLDLNRILAFRYEAAVANDNTVQLGGLVIQIPPGPGGLGYAKARVEVRQHLNGSWSVYHRGKLIARADATPLREPLRSRGHRRDYRTKAAHEVVLLYPTTPDLKPEDIFPRPLRGHIASA
jgi:transposase